MEPFSELSTLDQLKELRSNYSNLLPEQLFACQFLSIAIRAKSAKRSGCEMRIFRLNDHQEDSTFLAIIEFSGYDIFCHTLEPGCHRLKTALLQTRLIDWSRKPMQIGVHNLCFSQIVQLRHDMQLSPKDINTGKIYYLPREKALKLKVDSLPHNDVRIAPLSEHQHATAIYDLWPLSYCYSLGHVCDLLAINGGFGMFGKTRSTEKDLPTNKTQDKSTETNQRDVATSKEHSLNMEKDNARKCKENGTVKKTDLKTNNKMEDCKPNEKQYKTLQNKTIEDYDLRSWVTRHCFGGIALLQTSVQHLRKGYAKTMVAYMAHSIATEEESGVMAYVEVGNTASDRLFQSLGFKVVSQASWLHF